MGSLDSLLDTMTNVVGILVILLAVTQMGVGDAVQRIRGAMVTATPKEFELLKSRASELERLVDEQAEAGEEAIQRTQVDSNTLATTEILITDLKTEIAKLAELEAEAQQARASIGESQDQIAGLRKQVTESELALVTIRDELENTPKLETPTAKVVRLPNPREVPKNWTEVLFICQHGRIMKLDPDAMLKRAYTSIERVARRNAEVRIQLNRENTRGNVVSINCKVLVGLFERIDVGGSLFRISVEDKNGIPHLVYTARDGKGETVEDITAGRSFYRLQIRKMESNEYARFLVWPDSFDVYLAARDMADEFDVAAGWELRNENSSYSRPLLDPRGRRVVCEGHKEPPPAKPPAKPPVPDPALQGRKVPPRDVVD